MVEDVRVLVYDVKMLLEAVRPPSACRGLTALVLVLGRQVLGEAVRLLMEAVKVHVESVKEGYK